MASSTFLVLIVFSICGLNYGQFPGPSQAEVTTLLRDFFLLLNQGRSVQRRLVERFVTQDFRAINNGVLFSRPPDSVDVLINLEPGSIVYSVDRVQQLAPRIEIYEGMGFFEWDGEFRGRAECGMYTATIMRDFDGFFKMSSMTFSGAVVETTSDPLCRVPGVGRRVFG